MRPDSSAPAASAPSFSGLPAQLPPGHSPVKTGRIGVLLTNLGTPDATDYWSMRRYLKEFLSDRRVIETSRLTWWPLLNLIILTFRPGRKGKDYASIWNKERDESPLKTITRGQADKLALWIKEGGLGRGGAKVSVDWAMRYGNPSIESRLTALKEEGCERILVVPLYPQYAAATTATACDKTFDALKKMRWQPTVRFSPPYHDDPTYVSALAASMRRAIGRLDFVPEVLLASFHGVPQEYLDKGDPYHCHCVKTWRLLRGAMGMTPEQFPMSFQSRFGPAQWLRPYTDATVKALAKHGFKRMAVVTPGFSADCLETLEEIGVENAHYFIENGGEKFAALPCLNDSAEGMTVIQQLVRRELSGWV
jgi:protoporphyrin/coproporphyrin ferrochelatase